MKQVFTGIRNKVLALLLVFSFLITSASFPTTVFAFDELDSQLGSQALGSQAEDYLIVTDDGVYIDGVFYSQEDFALLLENAIPINSRGLAAGLYFVPGVGQVLIGATGVVIVGGVALAAGTWLLTTILNFFAAGPVESFQDAWDRSASDAVSRAGSDANKRHHIMDPKHNWNKFDRDPNWSTVSPIIAEVLRRGSEQWERGDVYIRTLVYRGHTVVVRFVKTADGLIQAIGTAWTR